MRARRLFVIVLILAGIAFLLLGLRFIESSGGNDRVRSKVNATSSSDSERAREQRPEPSESLGGATSSSAVRSLAEAFLRPIDFHGIVLDENEEPVDGALVEYAINDRPDLVDSGGSRGSTVSGVDGNFTIRGRGLSIYVKVSKKGYYQVHIDDDRRASARGFSNQEPLGRSENPITGADKPAVFILRKMGEGASLIQISRRSISVAKDGTPTEISLTTGRTMPIGQGDLRVEAWTSDRIPDPQGRYEWRCRVTIPRGGLVEVKGRFVFEAPAEGYMESIEFGEKADKLRWLGDLERQFVVRLADGRYARVNFRMMARGDHFFVIEAATNPTAGDRNLEAEVPVSPANSKQER